MTMEAFFPLLLRSLFVWPIGVCCNHWTFSVNSEDIFCVSFLLLCIYSGLHPVEALLDFSYLQNYVYFLLALHETHCLLRFSVKNDLLKVVDCCLFFHPWSMQVNTGHWDIYHLSMHL